MHDDLASGLVAACGIATLGRRDIAGRVTPASAYAEGDVWNETARADIVSSGHGRICKRDQRNRGIVTLVTIVALEIIGTYAV
ncbi:MAG: hypothetical protein ACREP7_23870 [Lysobacter sp.]